MVQGPWSKTKRKVKLPDETAIELQERLGFAEELTQTVIIHLHIPKILLRLHRTTRTQSLIIFHHPLLIIYTFQPIMIFL